jgi:hypothetical protein
MSREAARKMSKTTIMLFAAIATLCGQSSVVAGQGPPGKTSEWAFDKDPVGGPPAGATVFSGNWAVRAEAGAPSPPNALCQTGAAEFPALSLTR